MSDQPYHEFSNGVYLVSMASEDTREIISISHPIYGYFGIGEGITKIVTYLENDGSPWLALFCDDFLYMRMDMAGCTIRYANSWEVM